MTEQKKDVLREVDDAAIRQARTLIRTARHGALATLDPESGAPIATRVAVASDMDGTPVILVSGLSAHTAALKAGPRCSLLVGEPGKGDPLAHPRMTIAARAVIAPRGDPARERVRRRYLNRHPKASLYADFPDFDFFRIEPLSASLNGGFGKAYALRADHLVTGAQADEALAQAEQSALDHMNSDHADAIAIYARAFAGQEDGRWRLTGIDREGIDLGLGDRVTRIWFDETLAEPADMRVTLVGLAAQGRHKLAAS